MIYVVVDLTGSSLPPVWRRVEVELDVSWDHAVDEQWLRERAAEYYGVPIEQVGPVTFGPRLADGSGADREHGGSDA